MLYLPAQRDLEVLHPARGLDRDPGVVIHAVGHLQPRVALNPVPDVHAARGVSSQRHFRLELNRKVLHVDAVVG